MNKVISAGRKAEAECKMFLVNVQANVVINRLPAPEANDWIIISRVVFIVMVFGKKF